MKVLFLSTFENAGGAAVAAGRLAEALRLQGVQVTLLVRDAPGGVPNVASPRAPLTVLAAQLRERLAVWRAIGFRRDGLFAMDNACAGVDITRLPQFREADIVNLHWINQGFLSLATIEKILQSGKPVVWTLHDMWPFTGGCHHAGECEGYRAHCSRCPLLPAHSRFAVRHHAAKRFLSCSPLTAVSVSRWLRQRAEQSSLFAPLDNRVIPNVIDTELFAPADRDEARRHWGLPADKTIVLMGAAKLNDPAKGFERLRRALELMKERQRLLLVLFGGIKGDPRFLDGMPVETRHVGSIASPRELASLYAASHLTVVPSLYETFGQTLAESMSCGRPAVSFGNSGQADVIDHRENGYLAQGGDVADLARGIEWVLAHERYPQLCRAARAKVQTAFASAVVARQYLQLYNELIENKKNKKI